MIQQPPDQYGRIIMSQDNGNGTTTYTVSDDGVVIIFTVVQSTSVSLDQIYSTINGMASN